MAAMGQDRRLFAATAALAVIQVVHAAIPADTESEGYVGPVVGLALLIGSIAAAVGAWQGRRWAPRLALLTGAFVSVGFTLYHAVPVHSPVTNPYPGEPVGAASWLSVAASVAIGAWAAYEGRASSSAARRSAADAPRSRPVAT
jgi:hypothetical protein